MKKFAMLMIAGIMLTSCKVVTKTYTSRSIPITREAIPYNPVIADIKVDLSSKISGTVTVKNVSQDNAKQLAIYNAMETSGADVVIDPIFKIETKGIKTTATVYGYFGAYENVHKATEAELQNLKLLKEGMPNQVILDENPQISSKKKKLSFLK